MASMLNPQDQYTFESKLGFGGQGAVYKAHDTYLDKMVAIKTIPTRVSEEVDDVLREARINSSLRHPNIVEIFTVYGERNSTNIVMELLPESLEAHLNNEKNLDMDTALDITVQICSAISFAHERDIFHRDLKPANILMSSDGTPKVSDFGLSRKIDTHEYETTGMSGTPPYMGPELFRPSITLQPSGDIYAIGIMLYQMIFGILPIRLDPGVTWDRAHRETEVVFPDTPEIPKQVQSIILTATAKLPSERYSSIQDLISDLNSVDLDGSGPEDYTLRQIDDWTRVINESRDSANRAHYNRGLLHVTRGHPKLAIDDFTQAISIDPEDIDAYNSRGLMQLNLGHSELAIDDFTQAIKINPHYIFAYNNRGIAHDRNGNYQMAIDDFTRTIQINPKYIFAYHNRAAVHDHNGNYQMALKDYTQAIRTNPESDHAYFGRGNTHVNMGNHQLAIDDYTQAIRINRNFADAYFNRGNAHINIGNSQLAIYDFTQVIKINPKRDDAYVGRGTIYDNNGNYRMALRDYTQAILINHLNTDAYHNRGNTHRHMENYQLAIDDFSQAINIDPEDAGIYTNRGNTHRSMENYQLAIDDYTQAIRIDPRYVNAYINRGGTHILMGNQEQGKADYAEAIRLAPSLKDEGQ